MNAKKNTPTLNDYLDKARNDAPVVSFEESARRLREAERRNKRRGVWWWFSGFAMPLRHLVSHAVSIMASRPFAGSSLAGAAAIVLMVWLWQRNVMLDGNVRPIKQQSGSSAFNGSQGTQRSQPQASEETLGTSSSLSASAQHSALTFLPPNNHARLLASTTTTSAAKSFAEGTISSLATEFSPSSTSALPNTVVEPEYSKRESAPQQFTTPETAKYQRSVVFRSDVPTNAPQATDSGHTAHTESAPLVPPALSEPSRFSVEFRLAARTSSDTLTGNGTALQNVSFGLFYRLSEHHSIGVEGGTQPLALSVRSFMQTATTTGHDATMNNHQQIGTTNQPPPSPSPMLVNTAMLRADSMRAALRTEHASPQTVERTTAPWFAAAYQYNHDIVRLGGLAVQPLARISLGGGSAGAVGRILAGISVFPEERFTVLLAAEGAALGTLGTLGVTSDSRSASSVQTHGQHLINQQTLSQQPFTISSQTGVTLGIAVKF
jgi:hypothetical protein